MTLLTPDDLSLLLVSFQQSVRLEHTIEENIARVMDFILLGFSVQREMEALLFLLILVVYSLTLVGNIGLISTRLDPHCHTPMYLFLSSLAFVDFCYPHQ